MKTFAYHCTQVDPKIILSQGFKAGSGGYTENNLVQDFYDIYLPANPMFVSSIDVKVWDKDAKYCMKVDISNLNKYPDFGHLLDFGAYFDENCFWWQNTDELKRWLNGNDKTKQRVAEWVLNELSDQTLYAEDFNGETSFDIFGTCAIDGDLLTNKIIIDVKQK